MKPLSRRDFVALSGAALAASRLSFGQAATAKGKLTAGEVVDRIKKHLDIPWDDKTFRDTFKIGGPDSPVNGIATSFGGSYRVLQKADRAGLNMLIVHEPTFYSDADVIEWVQDDPLYKFKLDWTQHHNTVIWRIHDHAHRHKPDFLATGFNEALGWKIAESTPRRVWEIPPTTLADAAAQVAARMKTHSVRVVGDPNLPVHRIAGGGHLLAQNVAALQTDCDCILISETREYDSFEYVRDAVAAGEKKGAIFVSHFTGEDEGMRAFATWLKPLVPELQVTFIPTTDQLWTV